MADLNDEDAPKAIREFVRNNPDIEVYEYVKRGFNGEVYFGKRKKMGDHVVLKFYSAHSNYDSTEEAVILKSIRHDHILEIYDLRFLPPNYAFFLSPKISGGDLQGVIDTKPLSSKEALNIISGLLLGLTELHSEHKIVHRDLKPGNILINLSNGHPIIADLGAVKKIQSVDGYVTASKSTYLYLPPESIKNNQYYFQSDIYQIGVIMFQLLRGFFPINDPYKWLTAKEEKQLAAIRNTSDKYKQFDELIGKKILKGVLADTNTLPYFLDPAFKRVLNKSLNADYQKRHLNASFLLKEIHQLQRNHPDYIEEPDKLIVRHDNGKEFRIYLNGKKAITVEKCIANGVWRKDNSHNGTMGSALFQARLK